MNNNFIDFGQLGGYRLEQPTFEKMQATYFGILETLMAHLNVPSSGKFIISGCELISGNINPGIMYIDGAICPFAGTTGGTSTTGTKIKKRETTATLSFQNGTNPAVFKSIDAVVDASGTALSAFTRIPQINAIPWANLINVPAGLVFDSSYVHTDVNFTLALWAKLMAIEDLAEVNVQSDWTETDNTSDAFIKNKPIGNLQTYLAKGEVIIGDLLGSTDVRTIPLGTNVGTTDYHVNGCLTGTFVGTDDGERWAHFIVKRKTNVSFDIVIFDHGSYGSQNFKFSFNINPL